MGMAVFFVLYGLAEAVNSWYVYQPKKEWFNLIATTFWGLAFVLVGLVEIFELTSVLKITYVIFGLSWLPMTLTPCAIKLLRKSPRMLMIRKISFLVIGICELLIVLVR